MDRRFFWKSICDARQIQRKAEAGSRWVHEKRRAVAESLTKSQGRSFDRAMKQDVLAFVRARGVTCSGMWWLG